MNFAFTEEQEQLRQFVRSFLEDKSSEAAVREQMETDNGYDDAVWSQMAEQLGLQRLIIPEAHGGQGFSFVELGVVLEVNTADDGQTFRGAPADGMIELVPSKPTVIEVDAGARTTRRGSD